MVKIVFTPDWFLSGDIIIEIISFMILLAFFVLATNYYRLNKKKSVLYLGIGFLLIAIGEASTIFTKLVLYYDTTITREIGRAIITSEIVRSVDIFYYIGFFFNKLFVLLGLYLIYKIPSDKKLSTDFFLIIYLLITTSLLSEDLYYIYNLTVLVLLGLIIRNYYILYNKNKSKNTRTLLSAFIILAMAQIVFIFSEVNSFYVIAQILQLVSYIMLLVLMINIQKNGTKEKQNRHLT